VDSGYFFLSSSTKFAEKFCSLTKNRETDIIKTTKRRCRQTVRPVLAIRNSRLPLGRCGGYFFLSFATAHAMENALVATVTNKESSVSVSIKLMAYHLPVKGREQDKKFCARTFVSRADRLPFVATPNTIYTTSTKFARKNFSLTKNRETDIIKITKGAADRRSARFLTIRNSRLPLAG